MSSKYKWWQKGYYIEKTRLSWVRK